MRWDGIRFPRGPLSVEAIAATLSEVSPAEWCRAFFLLAAAGVLAVAVTPREARSLLMDYGARKASQTSQQEKNEQHRSEPERGSSGSQVQSRSQSQSRLVSLVAAVTSLGQVPHSWFAAFYGLSIAGSIFWLIQYLTGGALLHLIASRQAVSSGPSATLAQVAVAWAMLFLQGCRRGYEHATIMRTSKSTIWFVHWLLGLGFYLFIGVSIWVEGSKAILDGTASETGAISSLAKILIAILAFLFAWVNQYRCHKHLAGLKKYSLPETGLFRRLVCPHYTCECLLYLSLSIATAPQGELYNRTVLCALGFVLVNLGVTTLGTRKWYAEKFGEAAVARKWNMIPFIF